MARRKVRRRGFEDGGSTGSGSDPSATGGGSFGGGSYSPGQSMGGQYSMAGTLGTLNSPTVNTGSASVSVFGGMPAGPQFGSGLGAASLSGQSVNPSAFSAPPGTFGQNSGALDPSQADPNKQPSTGLSPVSTGSVPTMGLLGNTPFSQQTMGLNPGSLDNGTMFNPGELNNNTASVPGSIGNNIPSAGFIPMAPVGPAPAQAGNVLSWSQEPASTQNAQAAGFMPSGLGYASLSPPSAPSAPTDSFGGTSLSPLNAGYSVLATPQERDMAIRTIAAEADPTTQGYAAVAGVIANRAALNGQVDPLTGMTYPGTVGGVVSQPYQFSGYNDKNYHGIDPSSDRYQHIGSVLDSVLSGNTPDPTNGATAYYAPSGMPGGLAPSWAKSLPPGQTIGTQVFFGGTPSQLASQAASVQPNNSPPSPYGGLYNPPPQLASINSMPPGLGYSTYVGAPTTGNAINIGPGGPQSGQPSLGTIASPWGTGTSDDAMNFAMARGPAGLAANMITPPNNNVLSWTAVPPTHSSVPQGDYSAPAPIRNPDGTGVYPNGGLDAQVPLSSGAPNPALATYDNGMLFNPNYGENNSGVLGQWGAPGSIQSQDPSVYSPQSPIFNRPYVAAYSPSLLGSLPPASSSGTVAPFAAPPPGDQRFSGLGVDATDPFAGSFTSPAWSQFPASPSASSAVPTAPTGVAAPAQATVASPAERPALTVPSKPTTARSEEKSTATSYDLHPVDYNPFPNSPTNLQGSAFLDAPTGQVGKAFNYLAAHGATYSPAGGSTGKSYSPATPPIIPPTTNNGIDASANASPPQQGWSKDSDGIWHFGPMPSGYVSPFPATIPVAPVSGFAGGGGVSFVNNNDPMADPDQSAKDDAYVPDEESPAPSYNLHPVPYDPFADIPSTYQGQMMPASFDSSPAPAALGVRPVAPQRPYTADDLVTEMRQKQASDEFTPSIVREAQNPGSDYNRGLTGLRRTLVDQPVGAAADFVTAPGRIMSGELTPSDPDFADSAIQGATMLTGRGLAAPGEGVGIFGGRLAATADHAALDTATALEKSGTDPLATWQQTGWYRGREGDWKFEIPDNGATYTQPSGVKAKDTMTLPEVLDHPALFDAYPELKNTKVQYVGANNRDFNGQWDPLKNTISMRIGMDKDTLMHEVQHAVQDKEGFTIGNNPEWPPTQEVAWFMNDRQQKIINSMKDPYASPEYQNWYDANAGKYPQGTYYGQFLAENPDMLAAHQALWQAKDKMAKNMATPQSIYNRTAGEVEARNVGERSIKDLSKQAPWMTEDTPANKQFLAENISRYWHRLDKEIPPMGRASGGAVKKRNKDEFDWNIPLSKQSESVQRLVRARLEA